MTMKLGGSQFLVRVLAPVFMILFSFMFAYGARPAHQIAAWALVFPVLLLALFMATLAEIRVNGQHVQIKWIWASTEALKRDVREMSPSFLSGISVLKLRRFIWPWGRVYFVTDWSEMGVTPEGRDNETRPTPLFRAIVEFVVVACFGLLAGRTTSGEIPDFRVVHSPGRIVAFLLAGILCLLFAVTRTKKPTLANVALWLSTWIVGLVR